MNVLVAAEMRQDLLSGECTVTSGNGAHPAQVGHPFRCFGLALAEPDFDQQAAREVPDANH
jgi:hypothetical protein